MGFGDKLGRFFGMGDQLAADGGDFKTGYMVNKPYSTGSGKPVRRGGGGVQHGELQTHRGYDFDPKTGKRRLTDKPIVGPSFKGVPLEEDPRVVVETPEDVVIAEEENNGRETGEDGYGDVFSRKNLLARRESLERELRRLEAKGEDITQAYKNKQNELEGVKEKLSLIETRKENAQNAGYDYRLEYSDGRDIRRTTAEVELDEVEEEVKANNARLIEVGHRWDLVYNDIVILKDEKREVPKEMMNKLSELEREAEELDGILAELYKRRRQLRSEQEQGQKEIQSVDFGGKEVMVGTYPKGRGPHSDRKRMRQKGEKLTHIQEAKNVLVDENNKLREKLARAASEKERIKINQKLDINLRRINSLSGLISDYINDEDDNQKLYGQKRKTEVAGKQILKPVAEEYRDEEPFEQSNSDSMSPSRITGRFKESNKNYRRYIQERVRRRASGDTRGRHPQHDPRYKDNDRKKFDNAYKGNKYFDTYKSPFAEEDAMDWEGLLLEWNEYDQGEFDELSEEEKGDFLTMVYSDIVINRYVEAGEKIGDQGFSQELLDRIYSYPQGVIGEFLRGDSFEGYGDYDDYEDEDGVEDDNREEEDEAWVWLYDQGFKDEDGDDWDWRDYEKVIERARHDEKFFDWLDDEYEKINVGSINDDDLEDLYKQFWVNRIKKLKGIKDKNAKQISSRRARLEETFGVYGSGKPKPAEGQYKGPQWARHDRRTKRVDRKNKKAA